ncbi:MAG: hypothetical protein EPO32_10230 [Anaerolineae bacterium]|nr:MAG: hypothetical protein EPO32_10230 [Anaerolineae bacterium]
MIVPDFKSELVIPSTTLLSPGLDLMQRLSEIRSATIQLAIEDARLERVQLSLDTSTLYGNFQINQLQHLRDSLSLKLLPPPIELTAKNLESEMAYNDLRCAFLPRYASFSREDKIFWLNNLLFLVTSDVREFLNLISNRLHDAEVGQRVGFSLVGTSGMGKSSMLYWVLCNNLAREDETKTRRLQNAAFVETPSSNRSEKFLPMALCWSVGSYPSQRWLEGQIISEARRAFAFAHTELLMLDEIVNVRTEIIRRLFIEICNQLRNTLIVCSGASTTVWAEGDVEVKGRWGEALHLEKYTGARLRALLSFVEILLPFTQPSYLALDQIKIGTKKTDVVDGPAIYIEKWTGGVLREIMRLIIAASKNGIQDERITMENLQSTWKSMHRRE